MNTVGGHALLPLTPAGLDVPSLGEPERGWKVEDLSVCYRWRRALLRKSLPRNLATFTIKVRRASKGCLTQRGDGRRE
jgi:hypothetical protein